MSTLDNLKSMPKGLLAAMGVVIAAIIGYGIYFCFGSDTSQQKQEQTSELIVFPDAEQKEEQISKIEELSQMEYVNTSSRYFNSLDSDSSAGGLIPASHGGSRVEGALTEKASQEDENLDPREYSELERYYISRGIKTRAEVDREHQEAREAAQSARQTREAAERAMAENSDSAMLARMDKAFALASKYSAQQKRDTVPQKEPAAPAVSPERKIDLGTAAALPTRAMGDDGSVITSLEAPTMASIAPGGEPSLAAPAKATFLKSEMLVTGQRVILRLMQDLRLSDGTVIPANTHIMGTCKLDKRLKIEVTAVNWGGHIYYARLDAYDQDGTEGIYCPVTVQTKGESTLKKIGRKVGQTATSIVGVVTSNANPYIANLTRGVTDEIVQAVDENGNVSVTVAAGYEFYVYQTESK